MCGIAGVISVDTSQISLNRLKKMTDSIQHRGPDGEGQWISSCGKIGLGHRRLSIIDLSSSGGQPMHYADGRYSITFNGEIYNYLEIKKDLISKGYQFNSNTDTEVLLALYDFKREKCVLDLDGMFAFVIFDRERNNVFCARDRFGEKPFFYSYIPGQYFLFGSEMKVLWAGGISKDINNKMLYNYLTYGWLENANDKSETFYNKIQRLENAHYLNIDLSTLTIKKTRYWDIDLSKVDHQIIFEKALLKFKELFYESIKRRLRSDVPVGSSLSGGIDSSSVVCVINELIKGTDLKQKTFSARFPGFAKDEGMYMEMVANKTNAEAFYTFPNDLGFVDKLNKVAYFQEEPFGSASACVQYDVMQLAKENGVSVLLDGQGADEILAGYHYYYNAYFQELKARNHHDYLKAVNDYKLFDPENSFNGNPSYNLRKKVRNTFPNVIKPYFKTRNFINELISPTLNRDFKAEFEDKSYFEKNFDLYSQKTLNGSLYYSTMVRGLSELLRFSDRNSMAHSREVRLPFLSHELVEFLFTLPAEFKINEGWTKYIMRRAFEDILPKEITWRKDKIGYEPPQKSWMDSPAIKEDIQSKKEILVANCVLDKHVLKKTPKSNSADSNENNSWSFWMAGTMFSKL